MKRRRRFVPARDLPLFPSHWSCRITGRWIEPVTIKQPVCTSNCADCGVGTVTLGEWYVVWDEVWDQAWAGRRRWWYEHIAGQEILCIRCLERRIGRRLTRDDFVPELPVNQLDFGPKSKRLLARLRVKRPPRAGSPRRPSPRRPLSGSQSGLGLSQE
jgi:hypothetical protein